MVTEREEKLAAARKKLARFQQTKTKQPNEQNVTPLTQSMSRDGSEQIEPIAPEQQQQPNGHQLMYSNPTPSFQAVQATPQQQSSLNVIQLAELEASKMQLKEHQTQIAQLEQQMAMEKLTQQESHGQLQAAGEHSKQANDRNRELTMHIEQLNAELVRLESMKNNEIAQHRQATQHSEQAAGQLNQQLHILQQQVEEYKVQVSNRETASISNQHQLHHRLQQQDTAIQILVEEKGELITRIKQMEEHEVKLKFEFDDKSQEAKRLDDALAHSRNELKTFKHYFDTAEQQKNESDEKLRLAQQATSKLRQENEIIRKRADEAKFMTVELQEQLKLTNDQMAEINQRKNMAEANLSQISCGSEAIIHERNQLVEKITEIETRYEQIRSQLDGVKAERDQLAETSTASSGKFQGAINDMNNQLIVYKNENDALKREIEQAEKNVVTLENKEDDELDELNKQLSSQAEILYELQDRVKLESAAREQCEIKINDMRTEKQQLEAVILREKETVEAFQRRCAELEDQKVQTKILLESSHSDRATISRVMQQNGKLKNEFEELQLQLVTVTNEKADMTVSMGTLEHTLNNSLQQLEDHQGVKLDKDSWRAKLEEHEQAILNLRHDLDVTKAEKKNLLGENIELSHSLSNAKDAIRQLTGQLAAVAPPPSPTPPTEQVDDAHSRSSGSTFSIVDYESDDKPHDHTTQSDDHALAETMLDDQADQTHTGDITLEEPITNTESVDNEKTRELELEKEDLTRQLLQAKQKHLELLTKVEGLQAQAPEVSELESLKNAKSALETKFVEIIDQNASIKDENEKLEALVHQLSAETDTIIEYVALYREQRSALAAKEKAREAEIASLSKSKVEMMERASQLELLLKATVQNIRVPDQQQSKQQQQTADDEDGNSSEENNEHPDKDDDFEVIDKEIDMIDSPQRENIDKILTLLDEIRDPFGGQSMPAMIGLEYLGSLQTI